MIHFILRAYHPHCHRRRPIVTTIPGRPEPDQLSTWFALG
jgi:hypothetical protein